VIDICTAASLRELTTPALLAVLTPVVIGFGIGFKALGAFLAAVILVGQLMANYLSNAGGSWDNAKKYIEDGNYGGKGSDSYRAAVIADTVGDPFKDTAGPALNPLIKVMNLVSLLILPAILSDKLVDVSTAEGVGGFGHVLNADPTGLARAIAGVALVVLIGAVAFSKRKKEEFGGGDLGAATAVGEAVEQELVSVAAPAASKAPAKKTAARKAPAKKVPAKKATATKAAPARKATKKRA
jgi:K(+)-stimulated pyrophosphate-energized sodium pump